MDLRPRTGAGGAGPSWYWPADSAAGGRASGDDAPPQDDDWATTSGFASGPTPPPVTGTHEDKDIPPDSDGMSSRYASGASEASWATEETRARTSTDEEYRDRHFHFRHRYHGEEDEEEQQEENDRRRREEQQPPQHQPSKEEEEQARYRRRFKPRTCRICFETVLPTFEDVTGGVPHAEAGGFMMGEEANEGVEPVGLGAAVGVLSEAAAGLGGRVAGAVAASLPTFLRSSMPRVRYISENPVEGKLISPCHCKGSQKYVHEGCLQAWRLARPMAERNYWKCPTCGFEYRMQRLGLGRLVSNKATRALLTLVVFTLTLFVLGFIADPLMDLWVDPSGMIMETFMDLGDLDVEDNLLGGLHNVLHGGGIAGGNDIIAVVGSSWWEHFLKGFFSLGIVGVVKTFFVVSPFTWWNLRGAGFGRGRRRAGGDGGRGRYESMGWIFILVGAFTFLGVSNFCCPSFNTSKKTAVTNKYSFL